MRRVALLRTCVDPLTRSRSDRSAARPMKRSIHARCRTAGIGAGTKVRARRKPKDGSVRVCWVSRIPYMITSRFFTDCTS